MTPDPAVRITDLRFHYGGSDFVLTVPSFCVERSEAVALIGPSGSGKTTLLQLTAGISLPTSGRVETDGVDVASLDEAARRDLRIRRLGLVFQQFELVEYLDVLDNILLQYRGSPALRLSASVRERARALAERLGIGDKLRRLPARLSQGELQRVAVCRALLTEPGLLLADEPTGNLYPANESAVLDALLGEARRLGASLVTVTHDRNHLDRFDRVIDMEQLAGAVGAAAGS